MKMDLYFQSYNLSCISVPDYSHIKKFFKNLLNYLSVLIRYIQFKLR